MNAEQLASHIRNKSMSTLKNNAAARKGKEQLMADHKPNKPGKKQPVILQISR